MEKKKIPKTENQLLLENEELRQRVYEYEETLNSIRNGEIDAIVVSGVDGEKIYSLTSAETKYRIIIEEMNEGAITTSRDGLITYCNARFAELISEPTETLVGSYYINYLQESEQPVFLDLLQSGLKGKIVGQITYRLNSGHNLELQLSISPIPADIQNGVCILFSDITQLKQQEKELQLFNNRLDHEILEKTKDLARTNQELKALHIVSMSMMEDAVEAKNGLEITNANLHKEIIERKKSEDELNESESKFRQTFDLSPVGIVMVGLDKRFIIINKAFSAFTGYEAEELIGKTISEVTHPDDIQIGMSDMGAIIKGEIVTSQIRKRYLTKDGQIVWGETMISLVRDSSGNPQYFLSIIQDITSRKQAEEEIRRLNTELEQRVLDRTKQLAKSNNLLDETGRLARVGGWEIDLITGKLFWSEATYKIHEVESGFEPILETAINFYAPESIPVISECVDRLINLGEPFDKELELITAKKNRIWVRALGEAYRENGKIVKIGGVFQDINNRKLTEEELKRRSVQLEAANKELEAFSYSVSHDLRAPLRAVHSYTNILLEEYEKTLDDEGKRICGIISSSSTHMGKLIDDLLSFSRIGRSEVKLGVLDMKLLATSVINEINGAKSKDRANLKLGKLSKAYGDSNLIRIVWTNLISNAIKYSSKEPSAEIVISSSQEDHTVTYSVKDNGVGFDMLYVHKLFGVFQRLHSESEFEGNGVGLAIVQRIILKHGGKVWAEGEVGKGATFYFSMPANEEDKRQK